MVSANWAQSFDESARALARKITLVLKTHEPVALSFRNASTLSPPDAAAAEGALERELAALGIPTSGQAGATTVAVALSDSFRGFVWVAEIRSVGAREVLIEQPPRQQPTASATSVVIEKKLLLEDDERILDLAPVKGALLVLERGAISVYESTGSWWQRKLSAHVPMTRPLPRDLRGRLLVQGEVYQAYLPGLACNGNAGNGLSITCRPEGLWPLGPNGYGVMEATRNFFGERLILLDGLSRKMPAFLSAASFSDRGRSLWVFTGMDGRAHLYSFDAAFVPSGEWAGWGSDLAVVEGACGARTLLITTGTGDETVPDFVQPYEWNGGAPQAAGDPVSFSGPLTALWPASERGAVLAVSRDLRSGRYAAFRLTIVCGR